MNTLLLLPYVSYISV